MEKLNNDLQHDRLLEILSGIKNLRIGVIGDGCLDMYWHADMTKSELSRETPHYSLPVVKELFSPGAGGNVALNLKALGCKEVLFCSVMGRDWRGSLLRHQFLDAGIDDSYTLIEENWVTPAYCKPIRFGFQKVQQEDARIDFVNLSPLSEEQTGRLLIMVDSIMKVSDAIVVNDQLRNGVIVSEVRERLQYWAKQGKLILVDSREEIGKFKGVITKPNELESLSWYQSGSPQLESTWDNWLKAGTSLSESAGAPCCLTLGAQGAIWFDRSGYVHIPAEPVDPPIDIVGAGDCFAASLASALCTGASVPEAISFAHLSSSIALKKLGTTGTASPAEIINRYRSLHIGS